MQCHSIPSIHTDSIISCTINESNKLLLSGGEDGLLSFTSLKEHKNIGRIENNGKNAFASLCCSPAEDHTVCASFAESILHLDLRKGYNENAIIDTYTINQDEINSISIDTTGKWLAAADDTGEILVLSLAQAGTGTKPQYKTLRRGHANIANAVEFRSRKPSELLSGGLDCRVVKWDYTSLKQIYSWNLSTEQATMHQNSGKICNPPMVHAISTPRTSSDTLVQRLFAVARGDGFVALYDGDFRGGMSSKNNTKSRSKKSSNKNDNTQNATSGGLVWLSGDFDQGGHSGAVNSVCFLPKYDETCLVSAGNDARVCAWNYLHQTDEAGVGPIAEMKHTAKINCIVGVPSSISEYDAVFGDVKGCLKGMFV